MLYEKPQKLSSVLPIAWGTNEIERLTKERVVYIIGSSKSSFQHQVTQNPQRGRLLNFTIVSFSDVPVLTNPYFKLLEDESDTYNFYTVHNYAVDMIMNLSDYYSLIDSVGTQLEHLGCKVYRVLKKPISFEPKIKPPDTVVRFYLDKPQFVTSFVESAKASGYEVFDPLPESLSVTSWKNKND